ncbi:MAG: GAF domain-containing protein [Desulfonauticus sp.]|nr:GAF domain-containing protein [Desulfonauticus sp.]
MGKNACLDKILGLICTVFDAYSAVLFSHLRADRYSLTSYFSLGDSINEHYEIKIGSGLVGWILSHDKPLRLNRLDKDESCLGYYKGKEENRIKAFMGCPLTHNKGVLCVDSKRTHSFSEKDLRVLMQFADLIDSLEGNLCQVELDFKKVLYYESLKVIISLPQLSLKWDDFLLKLLDLLQKASGFSTVFFLVRNQKGDGFVLEGMNKPIQGISKGEVFPMSSGLLGWVFANAKDVFRKQETDKPFSLLGKGENRMIFKTYVCLPMLVNKKTRSVLVLADEDCKEIEPELKNFLCMVKDYVSLFLKTLYFKNKVER